MVDLTTIDLGRDVPLIAEIVRQVEVQVVVATGIWRQPPRFFHQRSPDVAADLFVRDITQGIQRTEIRAGIIKCATDDTGVTEPIEIALRASARAHRRTGVPISTHTDAERRVGLDQQRIFAEEGVDLTRVIIGHSGDTEDLDYLKRMADAGSTLGMDRFGLHHYLPTDRRVRVIAELCKQGYADRMVLSHDASCHSDSRTPEYVEKQFPDWRYTHIPNDVIPALREAGVSESQIDQMTRVNPRRIFDRTGAY
jgi:phosphotriesterase-related protein